LKSLPPTARTVLGENIKTVQFGRPLGIPLIRKMGAKLWIEVSIVRVLFTTSEPFIVLLHGFIKKSGKPPKNDL
jgi:phage-related protein